MRKLYSVRWYERRKICSASSLCGDFAESVANLLFGFPDYGRIIAVFRHKEAAEEFARVFALAKSKDRCACGGRFSVISGRITNPRAAKEFDRAMAWIEGVELRQ